MRGAILLGLLLATSAGCRFESKPMRMREVTSAPPPTGSVGGGQDSHDDTPALPDVPPAPVAGNDAGTSACDDLRACCTSMTGDDEATCFAILADHDEPKCRLLQDRFCWFAQTCNDEGCSSAWYGRE